MVQTESKPSQRDPMILFLDIDGVISTEKSCEESEDDLDRDCVELRFFPQMY